MTEKTTSHSTPNYTPIAKWLHWLVAALILAQYLLIELAERADHAEQTVRQLGIIANHKSIGMTILLLALVRLFYRLRHPAPALPAAMPRWQIYASHASHFLLYGFLFALPISGWLMSSASAYTVSWFNLFALPDLIAANESNADLLSTIHERLSDALALIAMVHIAAALKHHLIDKDTVLVRMTSAESISAFFVVGIASVLTFGGVQYSHKRTPSQTAKTTPTSASETNALSKSTLPIWQIDHAKSHIKFTGEQAGAPFTGTWQQWNGQLQFDKAKLNESRFDVEVDITSVESNDDERDETILSADFFDAITFPKARFQAQDFTTRDSRYLANGQLIIKNISQPVTLEFTLEHSGKQVRLVGSATLERHVWNIGIGDWADPTWVGSEVKVEVLVIAEL